MPLRAELMDTTDALEAAAANSKPSSMRMAEQRRFSALLKMLRAGLT